MAFGVISVRSGCCNKISLTGWLHRNWFCHSSGGWEVPGPGPSEFVFWWELPGSQIAAFRRWPHMTGVTESSGISFSFCHKGTRSVGSELHIITSFDHNHLLTCPVSHTITCLADGGNGGGQGWAGLQRTHLGRVTVQFLAMYTQKLNYCWSGAQLSISQYAFLSWKHLCHLCSTSNRSAPFLCMK